MSKVKAEDVKWAGIERLLLSRILNNTFVKIKNNIKRASNYFSFLSKVTESKQWL